MSDCNRRKYCACFFSSHSFYWSSFVLPCTHNFILHLQISIANTLSQNYKSFFSFFSNKTPFAVDSKTIKNLTFAILTQEQIFYVGKNNNTLILCKIKTSVTHTAKAAQNVPIIIFSIPQIAVCIHCIRKTVPKHVLYYNQKSTMKCQMNEFWLTQRYLRWYRLSKTS